MDGMIQITMATLASPTKRLARASRRAGHADSSFWNYIVIRTRIEDDVYHFGRKRGLISVDRDVDMMWAKDDSR